MSNNYNFYEYGFKVAKDNQMNLEKLKEEIEQRYGQQAKIDFEAGYTKAMSVFLTHAQKSIEELGAIDYANRVDNEINDNKQYEEARRYGQM